MNCKDCRWWRQDTPMADTFDMGSCHRRSPAMHVMVTTQTYGLSSAAQWPQTSGNNGCGDFERMVTRAAVSET